MEVVHWVLNHRMDIWQYGKGANAFLQQKKKKGSVWESVDTLWLKAAVKQNSPK